jgi:chromosome partitioning protein
MGPDKGCRIVVLSGGKGGVGRSTLSRNFLVASALAGYRTIGFDLDRQGTLEKWHLRRVKTCKSLQDCVSTEVKALQASGWRQITLGAVGYQVAIVDTPPGIEENTAAMIALCQSASFVVVPCGTTHDDIESVIPWMRTLVDSKVSAAFVLNKANRRTKSYEMARATLLKCGPVCPIEVPQLEDIHSPSANGLCVMDYESSRAVTPIEGVWTFVRREIDL